MLTISRFDKEKLRGDVSYLQKKYPILKSLLQKWAPKCNKLLRELSKDEIVNDWFRQAVDHVESSVSDYYKVLPLSKNTAKASRSFVEKEASRIQEFMKKGVVRPYRREKWGSSFRLHPGRLIRISAALVRRIRPRWPQRYRPTFPQREGRSRIFERRCEDALRSSRRSLYSRSQNTAEAFQVSLRRHDDTLGPRHEGEAGAGRGPASAKAIAGCVVVVSEINARSTSYAPL